MPVRSSSSSSIRTLDLFAGCGGLTEGLSRAVGPAGSRFEAVAAIDNWKAACEAFALNHEVPIECDGVSRESVGRVLDRSGDVDVVVGGPPCQGFSTSGKRALDDPRNSLVRAFLDAVDLAEPRAFVIENVSGFVSFQGGKIFSEVTEVANELGFRTFPGIVLASLAGVPQRRRRFILVGLREGTFAFPGQVAGGTTNTETSDQLSLLESSAARGLLVDQRSGLETEVWSFNDATSDLPVVSAGESAECYTGEPQNEYQKLMRRGAPSTLMDHVASHHRDSFVTMMSYIPEGRSAMDPEISATIPPEIRPSKGFPNSYSRIRGSEPSPTITRNFTTPSSANCIHPSQNRALTLREGARCQSFPDRYRFAGTHGDRRLMIGNAVPPLLAKALGERLLESLTN